ncbi:MAG: carbohydrate-binding domain-containing protein [Bacteroidales bacterium]|nr:carbohydrate-binding domain-containing protein [Bacteroidales bacterium]
MKKQIFLTLVCVMSVCMLGAQEYYLHTHRNGNIIFEKKISQIDSINLLNNSAIFNVNGSYTSLPFSEIDSVTFSNDTLMPTYDIYIIYNGTTVNITNPLAASGVTITDSAAYVTVVSTAGLTDITYHLSGTTTDGSFKISSDKRFNVSLEGVSITSTTGAAINSVIDKKMTVILTGTNYLKDCANGSQKAAFYSKGQVFFNGSGTLTVEGKTKHAISSGDYIEIYGGNIVVTSAVSDGLHGDYIRMHNGSVTVSGTTGDGLDGDTGFIEINGGTLNVTVATADTKAVKCDSILTINGGTITITASGAQTKGLKSDQTITINGGDITITASGATVMETVDGVNDPSYCSAIVTDGEVHLNGGNLTITLPTSNNGGKGISADGSVFINGGTVNITTAGSGAAYTVSGSTKDSYSCSCIKSDAHLHITGGDITCSSSGAGGKGIRADSSIVIGAVNAADSLLTLNVSTSGARFTVSGGGGGWPGPGGDNSDYCNPKAIRSGGNLTINSGIITVTCTQSGEGGEGIESKNILNINGGQLEISSTGDDAINAANYLYINGGTTYATSTNNDAIDCNGPMYITGGFTIAAANHAPEEAFDCDNYTFGITGGTIVGTAPSGMYSSPTASACTQHALKYTHAGNNAVQLIRNSDNEVILTFKVPSISGGGGPGPGGGGSSAIMTFSSPEFVQGTYTLKYGGSITGGTNWHNYYTGATYSGGSSKTVTVGSSFSVVTAN